ncbi:AMP-binding protein [Shouchella shacheensis]|uniref:AMP-binding protein n=1 Tax=Shouchella shacheensis TaxID=1649580 RepID=UPI0007401074|nr:AMP-binding protein [Shouchella shacheensis]
MTGTLEVTVGELLTQRANDVSHVDAVVYPDRGLRLSYKAFDQQCKTLAKAFIRLGIRHGEHVAIWATNKPEWITTQFATAKAGAVLVTVSTNYQASELEYLLKQSDSTTLLLMDTYKGTSYIDTLYSIVPELKDAEPGALQSEKLPYLKNIIYLGEEKHPGMWNWKDLVALGEETSDDILEKREKLLSPTDVINMQYTSGTTGFPKGVMLTHHNIVNNGAQIASCMNLTDKDRLCIPVPFFHCFGCVLGILACVSKGASMVMVEEFEAEKVLQAIESEKCTAVHGVPTMFIQELNHPRFASYDLSTLRTGIMAGSTCPVEVMKGVVERMGARELTIAYGQTESSPVITQTRTDDAIELRVNSVGRALPGVEVKIVEPGTMNELAPGSQGELCTRGYHVMRGYYKNDEATLAAITEDGWLKTGDLAVMDENGYLQITGRLKDMIIRGGENIYPREIEEFLYQHPSVLDVQVIGVPDEVYGEEVCAWMILKEGIIVHEEDIRTFCQGEIAHHKIPRYFRFVDEYPMTASGKIQKFKMREQSEKWSTQQNK